MSVELAFAASDLAQMRFAVSPMWEIGPSFRLLNSRPAPGVHRRWAEQARPGWWRPAWTGAGSPS